MVKIMGFASSLLGFSEKRSTKKIKVESATTTYVCRDELDKQKPKIKKQVKFDLEPKYQQSEESNHEELIKKKNNSSLEKYNSVFHEEKGVQSNIDHADNNRVKVKILMKKEDAAKLLFKCKEGGVLEFMDVAQQLALSSSVKVLSSTSHTPECGSLKAIPEEYKKSL